MKQISYDTITEFIVTHPGEVANLVLDVIAGKYQPDLVKAAKKLAEEGIGKYIIFGHTHDALSKDLKKGRRHLNTGTWRKFIEPWRRHTRRIIVPSYQEGGAQFYGEQIVYRYTFKFTINLSYVLFYEKGEGKVGPRLIQEKQEGECLTL